MSKLTFYIADVFAETKYAGNQLAVFRGGAALSDAEMQRIAREMNFAETTFIIAEEPHAGGYDVRIFTPEEEVPFAGHPTLGTAHIIRHEIAGAAPDTVVLNLKVGQIPVTFAADGYCWMKQMEPSFGETLAAAALAPVLGIGEDDIDERFPIQQVSTGLPHIIVPLKSLAALKRCRVNTDWYNGLVERTWAKAVMVFSPEPHEAGNDVSVRNFVGYYGVPEDPATGSGNGCLAAYLVCHRYFGSAAIDVRSEQGYEVGRPSLLLLRAAEHAGGIEVFVGGRVITVAKGEFV